GEAVNLGVSTTLASGTGNVIFGKAVTATGASTLTVNGTGTTQINGGSVTTNANQTYNEAVSLGANAILAAGTGNVTFAQAVSGVGAASLTITGIGTTNINGGSVTTNANQSYGEAVLLGVNTTLAAG